MFSRCLVILLMISVLLSLSSGELPFNQQPDSYKGIQDINLSEYSEEENRFSSSQLSDNRELGYLIQIEGNKTKIHQKIEDLGGNIKHSYDSLLKGFSINEIGREDIELLRKLNNTVKIRQEQYIDAQIDDVKSEISLDHIPSYSSGDLTGEKINISVIDSGVDYTHPALGNDCTGFKFEIGDCNKVTEGYDFVDDDQRPMDQSGHGTHVAGIAAANGEKIEGIAPQANIHAYRVLDESGGTSSDLLAALERSVENNANIIVMSLGSKTGSPGDILSEAVNNASEEALVVVAAGNKEEDRGINTIQSPGDSFGSLTVGTSNGSSAADFSGRGPEIWYDDNGTQKAISKPDMLAPGIDVNSTLPNGKFGTKTGTSMSTPVVAGVAALLYQDQPNISIRNAKSELKSSTEQINGYPWETGSGVINGSKLFGRPSLRISKIDLKHVNKSNNRTEIEIENPSSSESLNLSIGFSNTYNISSSNRSSKEVVEEEIFSINQSNIYLDPNESKNVTLNVNPDIEGIYSTRLNIEEIFEEYSYSRSIATSVGTILENGSEIELSLKEKQNEFIRSFSPGISRIYDMEDGEIIEKSISQGEVIQADPGNYTYVAAHSKGLEGTGIDPFHNAETNFIYLDNFKLENDTRYVIDDTVRNLPNVLIENKIDGDELQLEGSSIGFDIQTQSGTDRVSYTNNLNVRSDLGPQKLYYGGDIQFIEKWGFGAYSRDTSLNSNKGYYPTTESLNEDLFNSSQSYIYYDIFNQNPNDINLTFDSKETVLFNNSGVYSPTNITDINSFFYYDGIFNPLLSLENNKIMAQNDFLNLTYDNSSDLGRNPSFIGDWDGKFRESIQTGDNVGGLPVEPPVISWNTGNLKQNSGFGSNNSIYYSNSKKVDVKWETFTTDEVSRSSDYWDGFQIDTTGWTPSNNIAYLQVDYPTDFALQSLTEIDAKLGQEGEIPHIDSFLKYEPKFKDDWNLKFSHSGKNTTIYKYNNAKWEEVKHSSSSPAQVTINSLNNDKLDLRIRIADTEKVANYTFQEFASKPIQLSSNLNINQETISGNITLNSKKIENLKVKNVVEGTVNAAEYSNGGINFERKSCQLEEQNLQAEPYLHFTYSQEINSGSFDPQISYNDNIFSGNQNNITIDSGLNCDLSYKLATNETGVMTNKTKYNAQGNNSLAYFEWKNETIDNGKIKFQIWAENNGDWYRSATKNFSIKEFKVNTSNLKVNQFSTIKTSHKSNITINSTELDYKEETERRKFVYPDKIFGFEEGMEESNISAGRWYQSKFAGSGNNSAAINSQEKSNLSLNFSKSNKGLEFYYIGDIRFSINDKSFQNLESSKSWKRKIISNEENIDKVVFRSDSGAVDSVKVGKIGKNYSIIFKPRSSNSYEINAAVRNNSELKASENLTKSSFAGQKASSIDNSSGSSLMVGDNYSRKLFFSAGELESYNFSTNGSLDQKSVELENNLTNDSITEEEYYDISCGKFQKLNQCGELDIDYIPREPGKYSNTLNITTSAGSESFNFNRIVYGRNKFNLSINNERNISIENEIFNKSEKFSGKKLFEIPAEIGGEKFNWNLTTALDSSSINITAENIEISKSLGISTRYKENIEEGNKVFSEVYKASLSQKSDYNTSIEVDAEESVFICREYSSGCDSNWNGTNSTSFDRKIEAVAIGREVSSINLSVSDLMVNSQALIKTGSPANVTITGENYSTKKETKVINWIDQEEGLEEKEGFSPGEWKYTKISKFGNRSVTVDAEEKKELRLDISGSPENISFWYRGSLNVEGLDNDIEESKKWRKYSSKIKNKKINFSSAGAAVDHIKVGNFTKINGTYFTPRRANKLKINASKTVNGELFDYKVKKVTPEKNNFIKIIENISKGIIKDNIVNTTIYFSSINLTNYNHLINISTDNKKISADIKNRIDDEKGLNYSTFGCMEFQKNDKCHSLNVSYSPQKSGRAEEKINISSGRDNASLELIQNIYDRNKVNISVENTRKVHIQKQGFYNVERIIKNSSKLVLPESSSSKFNWSINISESSGDSRFWVSANNLSLTDEINILTEIDSIKLNESFKLDEIYYVEIENRSYSTEYGLNQDEDLFKCTNYSTRCNSGWKKNIASNKSIEAVAVGKTIENEEQDQPSGGGPAGGGGGGGGGAGGGGPAGGGGGFPVAPQELKVNVEDRSILIEHPEGQYNVKPNETELPIDRINFEASKEGTIKIRAIDRETDGIAPESTFRLNSTQTRPSLTISISEEDAEKTLKLFKLSKDDAEEISTARNEELKSSKIENGIYTAGYEKSCKNIGGVNNSTCKTYTTCNIPENVKEVRSCSFYERKTELVKEFNQTKSKLNNETVTEIESALSKNKLDTVENLLDRSEEGKLQLPNYINKETVGYSLTLLILGIIGIIAAKTVFVKIRHENLIKKAKSVEKELIKREDRGDNRPDFRERHEEAHEALKDKNHDKAEDIFNDLEEELDA